MKKKIDINGLIWFVILISFSYLIFDLLNTGDIHLFIHPKMTKYVQLSFVVFTVLSIIQIGKLTTISKKQNLKVGFIIFLVPLLLAFIVKPESINAEIVAKKGIDIVRSNSSNKVEVNKSEEKSGSYEYTVENEVSIDKIRTLDTIETNESNYLEILWDIHANLDEYKGKTLITKGFIYREDETLDNVFIAGRMVMVCCAADSQITGFLCEWENAKSLENDSWFMIEGVIDSTIYVDKYNNSQHIVPSIKVKKITKMEAPKNQFVFP